MSGKIILFLVLHNIISAVSENCQQSSSEQLVIQPDTRNCSQFKVCTADGFVTQHCPGQTVFNPQLKVCDHPENVDLPEDYCEYDDILYLKPHFCDCRKYVICEPGKPPQVIVCPLGRRFRYFRKHFVLYKLGHNFCTEGRCN
ncbi:unnamed protein product [Callosobruchus maculatus]|uniref:Chitin-binding type-2 domain-containing protein n=1 Tax=Callosobruchus maculatus TaxID=64391 RepID=A0A653CYX0_CALMS|nr:unnamed protein product [Callosobruchus maculatus]